MARRIALWAGAMLVGVLLGAGSALWALNSGGGFFQERYGAWTLDPLIGAQAGDPYGRALAARTEPLALRAREEIVFTRDRDDTGAKLDEACIYELSGVDAPARWWSVTIYTRNGFLPRNDDHAFTMDATRAGERDAWSARLSAVRGDAIHWISTRAAHRDFILVMRLYQPRQEYREHPESIPFPSLTARSCPQAAA